MYHGDGDHHGGQVLWRWRSPYEERPYCVTIVCACYSLCFTSILAWLIVVERSLTNVKLTMPLQLKLAPSHVL